MHKTYKGICYMGISHARQDYIRETLQTHLGLAKVPLGDHPNFIAACLTAIRAMNPDTPLPDKIFDVSARISRISRKENISPDEAREKLIGDPALLFGNSINKMKKMPPRPAQDKFNSPAKKSSEPKPALSDDDKSKSLGDVDAGPTDLKKKERKPLLALDDIAKAAWLTQENDGGRPTSKSGVVRYGTLADGKLTWMAVENAFRQGVRGLKDCGHTSLANFLNDRGIGEPKNQGAKTPAVPESLNTAAEVSSREAGHKNPVARKRRFRKPTPEEQAALLQISFKRYFAQQNGGLNPPPTKGESPIAPMPKPDQPKTEPVTETAAPPCQDGKICAREIFKGVADYAIKGIIPKSGDKTHIIAGMRVAEASAALRDGAEGWKTFTPREDEPPSSVGFFAEATGLAKREGGKLVPAPAQEIRRLLKEHGLS